MSHVATRFVVLACSLFLANAGDTHAQFRGGRGADPPQTAFSVSLIAMAMTRLMPRSYEDCPSL